MDYKMFRVYAENKSHYCLTLTRQPDGRYTISHDYYNKNGYYNPSKSYDTKNWDYYGILNEIDSVENSGLIVKKYQ